MNNAEALVLGITFKENCLMLEILIIDVVNGLKD